jgi:hypothetical protein
VVVFGWVGCCTDLLYERPAPISKKGAGTGSEPQAQPTALATGMDAELGYRAAVEDVSGERP